LLLEKGGKDEKGEEEKVGVFVMCGEAPLFSIFSG
jgi:hypothetical protein